MTTKRQKPIGFDDKLQHSIDIIRKSERLAMRYDKEDGFFLAFSGGKDSQALYHVAQMAGVRFRAHFSPTTVDPPAVIRFIRTSYPDVVFDPVRKSIYDVAVEKQILPTQRVRWCCQEFKEGAGAGKVTLIGIRKAESVRRAKRNEIEVSSRKFSGDLEGFAEWQKETILKKLPKNTNFDEFSIDTDTTVKCIGGKDSILVSPIIDWTEDDVWYFLDEVAKVPHCDLYDRGWHRLGCICCPMSSRRQKRKELAMYPHVKRKWIEAIRNIRRGGVFAREFIWWNIPAEQGSTHIIKRKGGNLRPWLHPASRPSTLGWGGTDGQEPAQNQQRLVRGFSDSPSLVEQHDAARGGKSRTRKWSRQYARTFSTGGSAERVTKNGMQTSSYRWS